MVYRYACLPAGRFEGTGKSIGMVSIYIIKSQSRNYIYVGLTNDVRRRLYQHQEGQSRTTRAYRPFQLIHTEVFNSREEARTREKFLKSGFGKEWIKSTFQ